MRKCEVYLSYNPTNLLNRRHLIGETYGNRGNTRAKVQSVHVSHLRRINNCARAAINNNNIGRPPYIPAMAERSWGVGPVFTVTLWAGRRHRRRHQVPLPRPLLSVDKIIPRVGPTATVQSYRRFRYDRALGRRRTHEHRVRVFSVPYSIRFSLAFVIKLRPCA